jgi:hypothetical protein
MSGARARALELFEHANAEPPHSQARVDALLETARAADAAADERLGYLVRESLLEAAMWSGRVREMLVAFAWCLAQCDRNPTEFPESALHWSYKWVLDWVPLFPEISREQVAGLLEDASARFQRRGAGAKALAKLRALHAAYLGDLATLEESYALWKRARRDALSDCALCDSDGEVEILLHLGRDEEALTAARTLVRRGSSCAEVPHITYARALPAMLRLGLRDEAVAWQKVGFGRLKALHEKNVLYTGHHLVCTAVVGDLGRGLRILRSTMQAAAAHSVGYSRMVYLVGASILLERLAPDRPTVRLALPRGFGGQAENKDEARSEAVAELGRSLALQAEELARRFDARNGNTAVSRVVGEWWRFRDLRLPGPLPEG